MTPSAQAPMGSQMQLGTVGWVDDGGSFLDLGDSTNDGNTLVRVTLFSGRTPDAALDQTQAQGTPLLCQLASHVPMPTRGTRVIVAVPEPHGTLPGSSFIIGAATNNWQALGNAGAGEQVFQVPGCPARIVLRKATSTQSGGAFIFVRDTKGNDSGLGITPDGLLYFHPSGTLSLDGDGFAAVIKAGASITLQPLAPLPSPLDALPSPSAASIKGTMAYVDGTQVMLGPNIPAQVYSPAAYGPDPSPGPLLVTGIKSTSVKIAP